MHIYIYIYVHTHNMEAPKLDSDFLNSYHYILYMTSRHNISYSYMYVTSKATDIGLSSLGHLNGHKMA